MKTLPAISKYKQITIFNFNKAVTNKTLYKKGTPIQETMITQFVILKLFVENSKLNQNNKVKLLQMSAFVKNKKCKHIHHLLQMQFSRQKTLLLQCCKHY